MIKYLIDANLPYYFSLWNHEEYIHVKDIDDEWSDEQIWNYATENNLTIVSKDSDFSNRIIQNTPPPRVIHIRFGNVRLREFYALIVDRWDLICSLSTQYKLVNVFRDRIEGID